MVDTLEVYILNVNITLQIFKIHIYTYLHPKLSKIIINLTSNRVMMDLLDDSDCYDKKTKKKKPKQEWKLRVD